jgi:hypothetical protein
MALNYPLALLEMLQSRCDSPLISNFSSLSVSLPRSSAKDEFEDMSDDDVALLFPIGESEDGAGGKAKCGVERPGSWDEHTF